MADARKPPKRYGRMSESEVEELYGEMAEMGLVKPKEAKHD